MTTDEDWRDALQRFRFFRFLEDRAARERAEELPALLEKNATALYRAADRQERTGKLDVDLARYSAKAIASSLEAEGYAVELAGEFYSMEFVPRLPDELEGTPAALRSLGAILQHASEHAQRLVSLYLDSIEMIRERTVKRPRDHPSVSGWWLTRWADARGVSNKTIAKQLVAQGIKPDTARSEESSGESPTEEQMIAQWEESLKKIRPRARKRGSGTD